MLERIDKVVKDGEVIECGKNSFLVLETPGHTWGTASYAYDAIWNDKRYRAVTIGGQGLNAIESPGMNRLAGSQLNICVDLTAHPFTTGLTERIPKIQALRSGGEHPLINRAEYLKRLLGLQKSAETLLSR